MTRTRLPRTGEVSERCRLCEAPLDASLENPRRVCAACGEVNFPSKHSGPAAAPPETAHRPKVVRPSPPKTQSSKEFPLFWLGGASTGLTVFGVFLFGQLTGHLEFLVSDEPWARPLGAVVALSFVRAVWLIWRRKMNLPVALVVWALGVIAGYAIVGPVAWLLFMGITLLPALWS